jgi:hypothetical protein
MTTQLVTGVLNCSSGFKIPLNLTMTDASEANLTTDTGYTVTAQNIGDFANGQTVVSGIVTAATGIGYAYILRKGLVLALIPFGVSGVVRSQPALHRPVRLMPGDLLRVLPLAAAARNAHLCVITNQGTPRIFYADSVPAGAATPSMVDLQTALSIGETLTGQVIVLASFNSIDGATISSVGCEVTMSNGNLAGSVSVTDPASAQPTLSPVSIPVALNYTAAYSTSA